MTLEQWLSDWLAGYVLPRRSTACARNYRVAAARAVAVLGEIELADVSASALQVWVDAMCVEGLAPSTVRLYVAAINRAFAVALAEGLVASNPARGVSLPRSWARPAYVDPADVPRLVEVCLEQRGSDFREWYGPAFVMAVTTGVRSGELTGLRWPSVDLPAREVRIVEQVASVRGGFVWRAPKSKAGIRRVTVPGVMADVLEGQRERIARCALRYGLWRWYESEIVFPSPTGKPARGYVLNRALERICKRAGLDPVPVKGLRHTFATTLIERGVSLSQIAILMGHGRSAMTVDLYGHLSSGMAASSAGVFDSVLSDD